MDLVLLLLIELVLLWLRLVLQPAQLPRAGDHAGLGLDGHQVLDLVGLDLPPRLLDLDWELQLDLLGHRPALGLHLGLDLGLDLGRYVWRQGGQQLDGLLEAAERVHHSLASLVTLVTQAPQI